MDCSANFCEIAVFYQCYQSPSGPQASLLRSSSNNCHLVARPLAGLGGLDITVASSSALYNNFLVTVWLALCRLFLVLTRSWENESRTKQDTDLAPTTTSAQHRPTHRHNTTQPFLRSSRFSPSSALSCGRAPRSASTPEEPRRSAFRER